MDAKGFLGNYIKRSEKYYSDFFKKEIDRAGKIDKELAVALENLQNYMTGGKKARAALTVLGYQAAGGKDFKKILPVSLAAELMHNALVIHDDYIDLDEERRGKPTIHKIYGEKYGEHYGASISIVVGDIALFLAEELISQSSFESIRKNTAISAFNRYLVNTGYGEFLDIEYDYIKGITWEDLLKVRKYKTAHYTFVMPLTVGALLSGASKTTLESIKKYGENVGIAFQIHDDILGVFGDINITGKSNDSDIRTGKKTLLYFRAIELANKKDANYIKKWYGAKDLSTSKVDKIKEIIKESSSLEYSRKLSRELVEKGKKHIEEITKNKNLQETLSTFADYMIEREK